MGLRCRKLGTQLRDKAQGFLEHAFRGSRRARPVWKQGELFRMEELKRAISIRQPWVELILQGVKKAEYRSRRTKIRERVYVYASLTPADWSPDWKKLNRRPGELPTGAVLGTVEIFDCRWHEGRQSYAYRLRAPKRLQKPLIAKNQPQPGFWRPLF